MIVSYSMTGGGAERVTSTLINHLDSRKFKIYLCLVRGDIQYTIPSYVNLTDLNKTHVIHFPRTVLRLRKLIKKISPDVIMSNISFTSQLTGLALKGLKWEGKWIIRIGNNPASEDFGWKKRVNQFVYPKADLFVVNSKGLANGFTEFYPFTQGRTKVIQNATDFDKIDQMATEPFEYKMTKKPVILSIARLEPQKRHDILLKAFKRLREIVDAELWILGTGSLKNSIEKNIKEFGLSESVKIFGFKKNPYVFMKHATLFTLTSDFEGLPNALIEAQGLGLPGVSTNCPYGPEEIILHGKTGLLTPTGDVKALSKAYAKIIGDKVLQEKMGDAARKNVRKLFDKKHMVKLWEDLF